MLPIEKRCVAWYPWPFAILGAHFQLVWSRKYFVVVVFSFEEDPAAEEEESEDIAEDEDD